MDIIFEGIVKKVIFKFRIIFGRLFFVGFMVGVFIVFGFFLVVVVVFGYSFKFFFDKGNIFVFKFFFGVVFFVGFIGVVIGGVDFWIGNV